MTMISMVTVILSLLIVPQYLNHTGFCYAEIRYLSERELVDRFLFGDKADTMSFEEKVNYVANRWHGAEYPACCRADGETFMLDKFSKFTNKTFVGRYLFEFEGYIPVAETDGRHPYENIIYAVDSCGGVMGADSTSIDVNKTSYENHLKMNRIYWKDMESKK